MLAIRPKSFLVALASLLALFSSCVGIAKNCPDDDRYTLYFYSDSDAKVLRDQQRCLEGESLSNAAVKPMECRCYGMKYQDVVKKLSESSGPVAVATKKLSVVFDGTSCRSALDECEKACQASERSVASSECQSVSVAGIVAQ